MPQLLSYLHLVILLQNDAYLNDCCVPDWVALCATCIVRESDVRKNSNVAYIIQRSYCDIKVIVLLRGHACYTKP